MSSSGSSPLLSCHATTQTPSDTPTDAPPRSTEIDRAHPGRVLQAERIRHYCKIEDGSVSEPSIRVVCCFALAWSMRCSWAVVVSAIANSSPPVASSAVPAPPSVTSSNCLGRRRPACAWSARRWRWHPCPA